MTRALVIVACALVACGVAPTEPGALPTTSLPKCGDVPSMMLAVPEPPRSTPRGLPVRDCRAAGALQPEAVGP